jgi:hypothetical protein
MAIKAEHITGFALGVGAVAVGLVLYGKNRTRIHALLDKCGICTSCCATDVPVSMNLEELVAEKERLENIIAEREMAAEVSASAKADEPAS